MLLVWVFDGSGSIPIIILFSFSQKTIIGLILLILFNFRINRSWSFFNWFLLQLIRLFVNFVGNLISVSLVINWLIHLIYLLRRLLIHRTTWTWLYRHAKRWWWILPWVLRIRHSSNWRWYHISWSMRLPILHFLRIINPLLLR